MRIKQAPSAGLEILGAHCRGLHDISRGEWGPSVEMAVGQDLCRCGEAEGSSGGDLDWDRRRKEGQGQRREAGVSIKVCSRGHE